MSQKPSKKLIIIIAVCALIIISTIGVIIDFINEKNGLIAIISIAIGFVVMTATIVVDNFLSKMKAAKSRLEEEDDTEYGDDFSDEFEEEDENGVAQFLRRAKIDEEDENEDGYRFGSTYEGKQGEDNSSPENDRFAIPEDELPKTPKRMFGGKFNRSDAEKNRISASINAANGIVPDAEDEADFSSDEFEQEDQASGFEVGYDDGDHGDDYEEIKPVVSFGKPSRNAEENNSYAEAEQEKQEEQNTADSEEATDESGDYTPSQEESAGAAKRQVQGEPAATPQNRQSTAISSNMVVASQSPGQTLDSFFDDMDETDLVYRDCAEVWAADAKTPILKLMKYIEAIDDRKTSELLGKEAEYVNAMIDRLMYFSQMDLIDQMLEPKEYNFSVLVKECLKRFSPFLTEKKIGLLWKGLEAKIVTDKRWFVFALTQVIFNSVEFTPEGGKISISARQNGKFIDLAVEDSGGGIDPEELPYIFVAGYMGDSAPNPNDRRTGMGLFITRSVLEKLGGDCIAESVKGKGARIILRLPVAESAEVK